jgi:hypothetical protein
MAKQKHTKAAAAAKTDDKSNVKVPDLIIDYDGIWKKIITEFFSEFIHFFLPALFADINWAIPPDFLEQELELLHKELEVNRKITDRLVKVTLLTGQEHWILIHIEVQARYEIHFSDRMFLYNALIYAKFKRPLVALAIFTKKSIPKHFDRFEQQYYGTFMTYRYNAYCVVQQQENDLIANPNIFALFVLANLYVLQTNKKYEKRLEMKEKLFDLAMERQIPVDRINRFLIFVNKILLLPINLQTLFMEKVILKTQSRSRKPTLDQQLAADHKMFLDAFFEAEFGMSLNTHLATVELDKQKAEVDKQKAEAGKQKAEADKQKAEVDKQKAEAGKQKAEAKTLQMLQNSITAILKLHTQVAWSAEQIILIINMPLQTVQRILALQSTHTVEAIAVLLQQEMDNS